MKTILLIDDEPRNLEAMEDVLSRMDFNIIALTDDSAALALIRSGTPVDLVIFEYCLPSHDGLEFIHKARRSVPAVPIIMITGCGNIESYLKARNLGVFEYFNRPVRAAELKRVLQMALESQAVDQNNCGYRSASR